MSAPGRSVPSRPLHERVDRSTASATCPHTVTSHAAAISGALMSPRRERSADAPVPAGADGQAPAAAFSRSAQYRAHPAHSIFGGIARVNASAIAGSEVFVRISSSIAAA